MRRRSAGAVDEQAAEDEWAEICRERYKQRQRHVVLERLSRGLVVPQRRK